jgi:hypothetical protein
VFLPSLALDPDPDLQVKKKLGRTIFPPFWVDFKNIILPQWQNAPKKSYLRKMGFSLKKWQSPANFWFFWNNWF